MVSKDRVKLNADEIKAGLLQYYRYDRQFQLVALEAQHFHNADVVAVNGRKIIETEVKVSIADMKADISKPKHEILRRDYLEKYPDQASLLHPYEWHHYKHPYLPSFNFEYKYKGHQFYFAIPEELAESAAPIRNTYYPYAGLLLIRPEPYIYSLSTVGVKTVHEAYHFKRPKADYKLLVSLVKDQSATLARLAVRACHHNDTLAQEISEIKE